jgi:probable rRNA maturation factor
MTTLKKKSLTEITMKLSIDIQRACPSDQGPGADIIEHWVTAALRKERETTELSVRIVDDSESAALNEKFRGKVGSTNVLSFPFSAVTPEPLPILGDIVICAPVVAREALQQGKTPMAHWAHMTVHGVLHLLGYDHIDDQDAVIMESLETDIMLGMDFPPPYQEETRLKQQRSD